MRARYALPTLVYAAALAAAGVPFVILPPGILIWAPLYVVLCALSLLSSWLRRERSLWANLCAVLAASTMAIVIVPFGSKYAATSASATDHFPTHFPTHFPNVHDAAMFTGLGIEIAAGFALALFGSVLFVKTMIRERGRRVYLHASWTYHALLVAVGYLDGWVYMVLALLLLARAVALPLIARRRKAPAKVVGVTETIASLLMLILIPVGA